MLRNTVGTAVAIASTAVNSPEAGNVAVLAVKDGAIVKAGDLIAQLDDKAIRANIVAIRLPREVAGHAERCGNSAQTYAGSGSEGGATSQSGDDALAALKVAQAQLQVDQAQLAADQVTLSYTKIVAPFTGQLGVVQVSPGAYLSAGSSVATLTRMSPIYAEFTLPETDLARIRAALKDGTLKTDVTVTSGEERMSPKAAASISSTMQSIRPVVQCACGRRSTTDPAISGRDNPCAFQLNWVRSMIWCWFPMSPWSHRKTVPSVMWSSLTIPSKSDL